MHYRDVSGDLRGYAGRAGYGGLVLLDGIFLQKNGDDCGSGDGYECSDDTGEGGSEEQGD